MKAPQKKPFLLNVVGIKPANHRHKRMVAAYRACVEASINIPPELLEYFGEDEPDDKGVVVDLHDHDCTSVYCCDEGTVEVDLDLVPDGIRVLRFYASEG